MLDDAKLLDAWRAGDAAAGEALFDRHFVALYRFFFNKVGTEVDDLVQRTLLGCVESRDRFAGRASFRTFLFAVARKQLYAYYRGRPEDEAMSVSALLSDGPSPAEILVQHEEQKVLLRALRRLPFDDQIGFELFYWEGLEQGELAAVLGVPVGTVKSRLRAARGRLERELAAVAAEPELLASTSDNLAAWADGIRACVPDHAVTRGRRNTPG